MIYMFLSNNPSSGDINSSNLPCWLRNKKNNSLLCTLICGTDELPPLTCISHVLFISLGSLGD